MSDVAEDEPLVCVVDDAQWLDRASAQTLAFVARRSMAEAIGLLFAGASPATTRRSSSSSQRCIIEGISDADARDLLTAAIPGGWTSRCGTESSRKHVAIPSPSSSFRAGCHWATSPAASVLPTAVCSRGASRTASFAATALPAGHDNGCLLLPRPSRSATPRCCGERPRTRDRTRRRHARGRRGVARTRRSGRVPSSARPVGDLPRGASATASVCTEHSPTRPIPSIGSRSPGLASRPGCPEPDEEVADELERSAGRALDRGGLAAAAAFLERAAELTPDGARRGDARRGRGSAELLAGAPDAARNC